MTISHFRKFVFIGSLIALAGIAKADSSNWLTTFSLSAKGGHIIGNPAAATRLVEYGSYTCPHCRAFEISDMAGLKSGYIAGGKVSYEFRNFVFNAMDLTAAMMARCGGKGRFFGNHHLLFSTQNSWMAGEAKLTQATLAKLDKEDYAGFMQGAYAESGMSKIMAQRGITLPQANACLADGAALKKVLDMTDAALALNLEGTPSFLINGKLAAASTLAGLKPHLPK